ncbi:LacI family DNA-binding transcriptional regulator [Oceanobacillus sp. FSL K6-2867]|uniref:LacI family DNA-binding transcriptional regulator n=1 Tax=Oceanobacillus sp. FSL K6-2867 TaxID=2954748 RepID=UPI0030D7CA00
MKVTIYDVAKEAKVSIATVSKVINQKGRISEETVKKVRQAMEKLNYQPNLIASALMGKQTKTIGLLIPDLANPFFSELARSIEDRAHEFGYNIVMCSTDYQEAKEEKYIALLKQKRVDGFILASGFENFKIVKELINEDFPVAIVARDFPMIPINAIALDDFMGGYLAATHLINLGHTNVGVIALDVWSNRERIRGFRQGYEQRNLQLRDDFSYLKNMKENHVELGKRAIKKYIDSGNIPSAIFACNDLLAIGAVNEAKGNGLKIPRDLSVIGFDNTIIATLVDPPLTTIAQPIKEMGEEVIDLMISSLKTAHKGKTRLTLLPELVERQSTKPFHYG